MDFKNVSLSYINKYFSSDMIHFNAFHQYYESEHGLD